MHSILAVNKLLIEGLSNSSHVFLDDPELFPIINNPNTKKPLQDGHLCKTDTFQFPKCVHLKRFDDI